MPASSQAWNREKLLRYLPLENSDRRKMLQRIGVSSVDELFADVPEAARLEELLDLPLHRGEQEVECRFAEMAGANHSAGDGPFFAGAGAYRHHIPATVDHLIQRGEFLTAYTPYQPEISQGTLQCLFEFQTQVAQLTGMEVANASLYDGSTGCAEAILMARRVTRRNKAVLSGNLHPQYREVAKTITQFTADELEMLPTAPGEPGADLAALKDALDKDTSCVVVQNPDFFGNLQDLSDLAEATHAVGALLVVVVTEVVSLGAVTPPGEMSADIVVCEGQSIGNGLNFGGPYLGLFATRQKYLRQMPGRLCGQTEDADGRRGYVLTLSTREQHIRREKATSNICTNSGLCALAFTIHMSLLGGTGLSQLAMLNHKRAVELKAAVAGVSGVSVLGEAFFNEITLELRTPAAPVVEALAGQGIIAGVPASRLYPGDPALENLLVMAATEMTSEADIDALAAALGEALA